MIMICGWCVCVISGHASLHIIVLFFRMHVLAGQQPVFEDKATEEMYLNNIQYAADRLQKVCNQLIMLSK